MPMDRLTFIFITHNVPSISDSLSGIFEPYRRKMIKEDARKAGYDDVDKYRLDLFRNNPTYPARYYLECVNEHSAKKASCKALKESWLDCKAWQNEVDKMLKKDAIKEGYKEGYFRNKDPKHLAYTARLYNKCVAKHGGDNSLCKYEEKDWLVCKAAQNGRFEPALGNSTGDASDHTIGDVKADLKGDVKADPKGDVKGDLKDQATAADPTRISPEEMSKSKKFLEKNPHILINFRKVCEGYAYYQTATSVVKDTVNLFEGKRLLEEGFSKTPDDALEFVTGKPKYSLEDQLQDMKDELKQKMENGFNHVRTDIDDLRYDMTNIIQNVTKEACPFRFGNPKKVHNISPSAKKNDSNGKEPNGKKKNGQDDPEEEVVQPDPPVSFFDD